MLEVGEFVKEKNTVNVSSKLLIRNKCTSKVILCTLVNAAASQDQENSYEQCYPHCKNQNEPSRKTFPIVLLNECFYLQDVY